MTPDVAVPIDDGEVVSLVSALETEMQRWVERDPAQMEMTARGVEMVRGQYTSDREREDVTRVFGRALESVSNVVPASAGLNPKYLPSNYPELRRAVRVNVTGRKGLRSWFGRDN
jgi:hypothetical protein